MDTHTWRACAGEVASFTPLPDVAAGAVVATRSAVARVKLLTEDSGVAVLALAKEGALQEHKMSHVISTSLEGETAGDRDEQWGINRGESRPQDFLFMYKLVQQGFSCSFIHNVVLMIVNTQRFDALVSALSHLRGLCDTFAFPGALRVTEAAARLHAAAGLHHQAETQGDLRGCGGAHAQNTYNRQVQGFKYDSCSLLWLLICHEIGT